MARSSPRGFTLIELLIVIAIIGILMALLFSAFQPAINMARKSAAKNDVVQIANAVIAFQTEYGYWPTNSSESNLPVQTPFLADLTAGGTSTNGNPRQINFLDVGPAKRGKSGQTSDGAFVDPWGQVYQVQVDVDYDNTLSNLPGTNALRKTVAVWSIGVPKSGSYTNSSGYQSNANVTNFIKSWD